jgi:uncharacterized protein
MASALYFGHVLHARQQPVAYHFRYATATILVDIDQIANEIDGLPLLGLNRFNWLSLYYRDHGARDGTAWRDWIDRFLASYAIARPARVELLCYPRILGYGFNPLAIWYAYDAEDNLIALIAEVSNTFGQWHHYLLKPELAATTIPLRAEADKVFHVSPFIAMQARYHFRFILPGATVATYIDETQGGRQFFFAAQEGKRHPLTRRNLLKLLGFAPWRAIKVISLIHWWAVKILLKGGRFHSTPKALAALKYSHSEMRNVNSFD